MSDAFDPADPAAWQSRGRSPEHAAAIAAAWRTFPDLPSDAPLSDRMTRGRERIAAMRSVNDAIAADAICCCSTSRNSPSPRIRSAEDSAATVTSRSCGGTRTTH